MAPITQSKVIITLGRFERGHPPSSSLASKSTFRIIVQTSNNQQQKAVHSTEEPVEFDVSDIQSSTILVQVSDHGGLCRAAFTLDSPHIAVYGEQDPLSGIYKCNLLNSELELVDVLKCDVVIVTPFMKKFEGKITRWPFSTPQASESINSVPTCVMPIDCN